MRSIRVRLYDTQAACQQGCDELFQEWQELHPEDTADHYAIPHTCNEGWYHLFREEQVQGIYLTSGVTTTIDQLTFPDIDP